MFSQNEVPLYTGGIPNSKQTPDEEKAETTNGRTIVRKISRPTLTLYVPSNQKEQMSAVIVVPGGGYWVNAIGHEGHDVARRLNTWGVAAFVLKYRIPDDATMTDRSRGPLQDLQEAISYVRANAKRLNVDPTRIGVLGFSAGGHLASTAGTHFDKPVLSGKGNVRPDFMILVYPVISFSTEIGHLGSRDQLIGKNPSEDAIALYSNEIQVTPNTPPTFLVHAGDDDVVKVENSIRFYERLREAKVPAELHLYQSGGHGFGMHNDRSPDDWMERCKNWMLANKWLKTPGN